MHLVTQEAIRYSRSAAIIVSPAGYPKLSAATRATNRNISYPEEERYSSRVLAFAVDMRLKAMLPLPIFEANVREL